MGLISAPESITLQHLTDSFDCGENTLNDWLKKRALKNDQSGAARTFVVHQENKVLAYYSLATGSVALEQAPGKIKRNMPNPIPIMVLARLAVDQAWHGKGLGKALLKDAVLRTLRVAKDVGIRALLVHALSESAKQFYQYNGFIDSPCAPMTLMLAIH